MALIFITDRKGTLKLIAHIFKWLYTLVKNFTGSSKIFKDLLEDLGEDLHKDPQQRSLKILKDPNFSSQDPQKSLQRSSRIFKDL